MGKTKKIIGFCLSDNLFCLDNLLWLCFLGLVYGLDDMSCFVQFRKILLEREDDNSMDNMFADYFMNSLHDKSLVAWVAEEDKRIIAIVCLSICQLGPGFNNPSGKIAYVTNVYTIPSYRRQGAATNLMREAINNVKSLGIKRILLNSSDMAKSLYENLGFMESKNYFELKM